MPIYSCDVRGGSCEHASSECVTYDAGQDGDHSRHRTSQGAASINEACKEFCYRGIGSADTSYCHGSKINVVVALDLGRLARIISPDRS